MQIKRDYNQPFFRGRRRNRGCLRTFLYVAIIIAGLGTFVITQFDFVRGAATSIFGVAPTPTPFPSELASRASRAFLEGDLTEAVSLYESAIDQRPQNVDYLYEYGQILIDLDRADEVIPIAETIRETAPNDPRGYALETRAMVWEGSPTSAIPEGLLGMEIDNTFGPLYSALARAYSDSGDWQEGVAYGELAVQISPNDPRAHWSYAHTLTAVGAYSEAKRELEIAYELHPNFIPPMFELAFLYLASDEAADNQEAIAIYDEIIAKDQSNSRAHLRQCEAYRKVGQFERAKGFCHDAVTYDPDSVQAQFRLGLLYYRDRQWEEAQRAFQACVNLTEPDSIDCSYRLGLTYYYQGDCDNARDILDQARFQVQVQEPSAETMENVGVAWDAVVNDRTLCEN